MEIIVYDGYGELDFVGEERLGPLTLNEFFGLPLPFRDTLITFSDGLFVDFIKTVAYWFKQHGTTIFDHVLDTWCPQNRNFRLSINYFTAPRIADEKYAWWGESMHVRITINTYFDDGQGNEVRIPMVQIHQWKMQPNQLLLFKELIGSTSRGPYGDDQLLHISAERASEELLTSFQQYHESGVWLDKATSKFRLFETHKATDFDYGGLDPRPPWPQ